MDRYIAAAAQIDSGQDKELNIQKMVNMTKEAKRRGASFIAFPELASYIPYDQEGMEKGSESIAGPTLTRLSNLAKDENMWINNGSILERIDGDKKCYNSSIVISPEGKVVTIYRKIHLFDVDLEGSLSVRESARYSPGSDIEVCPTDEIGNLGMSICYDVRFPELYRTMAIKGAQVMTIPASFTDRTGSSHWAVLLRARAIENLCYIIAPGQIGKKPKYRAYGKSTIVDPWGTITATKAHGEGIITSEIDLERVYSLRSSMTCLENRRPELYE